MASLRKVEDDVADLKTPVEFVFYDFNEQVDLLIQRVLEVSRDDLRPNRPLPDDEPCVDYWIAYDNILGNWFELDGCFATERWIANFPHLLRCWSSARFCVRSNNPLYYYPEVLQEYCIHGGVGKISYHTARELLQEVVPSTATEKEIQASYDSLEKLYDYREALIGLHQEFSEEVFYRKNRYLRLIKRFLDQFSYEIIFAGPMFEESAPADEIDKNLS